MFVLNFHFVFNYSFVLLCSVPQGSGKGHLGLLYQADADCIITGFIWRYPLPDDIYLFDRLHLFYLTLLSLYFYFIFISIFLSFLNTTRYQSPTIYQISPIPVTSGPITVSYYITNKSIKKEENKIYHIIDGDLGIWR